LRESQQSPAPSKPLPDVQVYRISQAEYPFIWPTEALTVRFWRILVK
jgi:hypothetical protein